MTAHALLLFFLLAGYGAFAVLSARAVLHERHVRRHGSATR